MAERAAPWSGRECRRGRPSPGCRSGRRGVVATAPSCIVAVWQEVASRLSGTLPDPLASSHVVHLPVAADAAFYSVFGVFVAAFLVLFVVTMRWAMRRDRAGRAEWVRRQQERSEDHQAHHVAPARTNGHVPRPAQSGHQRRRRRR